MPVFGLVATSPTMSGLSSANEPTCSVLTPTSGASGAVFVPATSISTSDVGNVLDGVTAPTNVLSPPGGIATTGFAGPTIWFVAAMPSDADASNVRPPSINRETPRLAPGPTAHFDAR